jgi:hypothetical protein
MKNVSRTAIAALLCASLGGCATPPQQHSFDKSQTYPSNFDATWMHLVQYFTSNNIQVKTIEKASGVLYAEKSFVDYANFADCGKPGIALVLGTVATLNVFVVSQQGTSTSTVTVNTTFVQTRQFDTNIWTVPCVSTGELEQQIMHSL